MGEHHGGSYGVYMDHKIRKLRRQNASLVASASSRSANASNRLNQSTSSEKGSGSQQPDVFADVHVYVDGYTTPSKEEIRQLLLLHGGGFEHYETARVTHIIATHLPASKLLQLQYVARKRVWFCLYE